MKNTAEIEIRGDGIYLLIDNSHIGEKIKRHDVLQLIEENGITGINFVAINEVFKSDELKIEKKISSVTDLSNDPEKVSVLVSNDKLYAYLRFAPPKGKGELLTKENIMDAIKEAGVSYGIQEEIIEDLSIVREYDQDYEFATGIAPEDGKDGYLEMHFDTSVKDRKPKVLENGNVDFRELDLWEIVHAGQVLITAVDPVPGADGIDVFNNEIKHKVGKPPKVFPQGKNVSVSPDGKQLLAEVNGKLEYTGTRLHVFPILEINENVDNTTGNITFNGAVMVHGSVLPDFSITAEGDVTIHGVVEGAQIYSEGNVNLQGGIQGRSKAQITAGGDINTKYVEKCTLISGGDIFADCIMHSNVECGGKLIVSGKKGLLVGGKVVAYGGVEAKIIGSPMATATEVVVGQNPELLEQHTSLKLELEKAMSEYLEIEKTLRGFLKEKEIKGLTEQRKAMLMKVMHKRAFVKEMVEEIERSISELLPKMGKKNGFISASAKIQPGVKVVIGNAMMFIRDEIPSCRLINEKGKVSIRSFI